MIYDGDPLCRGISLTDRNHAAKGGLKCDLEREARVDRGLIGNADKAIEKVYYSSALKQ